MSALRVKAEKLHLISNSEALKYIREYVEREKNKTGTIPILVQRVSEYLHKFSKVSVDNADELEKELKALGLREESIIMIMNICPKTHDELRALLVFEERVLETEQLDAIIKLLEKYCVE